MIIATDADEDQEKRAEDEEEEVRPVGEIYI